MSTGDQYLHLVEKRLVGHEQFRDYFLDALRKDFHDTTRWTYNSAGTFTLLDLAGSGNDEFDIIDFGSTIAAIDGAGNFLNPSARASDVEDIQFENTIAVDYDVAVQKAEIPNGLFINPADGLPQFDTMEEVIGWQGEPDVVADDGDGTMTFTITSLTESGVSNAGRTAVVWKKQPGKEATVIGVAMESLAVAYTGGLNKINTVANFGQGATGSEVASDYYVTVLGPRVSRNTALHTPQPDDWCYVASVTGVGAGSPPTVFDNGDQTQLDIPITDFSQATRYDGGRLKIDVQALITESNVDQIRVTRLTDGIKFKVDELGNTTIEGDLVLNGGVASNITPGAPGAYSLGALSFEWAEVFTDELFVDETYIEGNSPGIKVIHTDGSVNGRRWNIDFGTDKKLIIQSLTDADAAFDVMTIERTSGNVPTKVQFDVNAAFEVINTDGDYGEIRITSPGNDPDEATFYMALSNDSTIDFGIIDSVPGKEVNAKLVAGSLWLRQTMRIGGLAAAGAGDALTVQGGSLSPHANGSQDLGKSLARWGTVWADELDLSNGVTSDLHPDADDVYDLGLGGGTPKRWANIVGKYLLSEDATTPELRLRDSGEGSNDGNWAIRSRDEHLYISAMDDSWSELNSAIDIFRGVGAAPSIVITGQTIQFNAGTFFPGTTDVVDLGTGGQKWHDAYIGGVAYVDELVECQACQVFGDPGSGVASRTTFTNVATGTPTNTGVGTILLNKAGNEDNAGFIKVYLGTATMYIPYFDSIA